MKKLLFSLIICTFFTSACQKTVNIEEVENNILEYYNALEYAKYQILATTSIDNKSQQFLLDFSYNYNSHDEIIIKEPLEVCGITAQITKNDNNLNILFDGLQVETLLAENFGINPVDVASFAIFDIKNKIPHSISVNDIITLSYIDEQISKEIFINPQTYDILKIEVYIDNSMVIFCDFEKLT